MALGAEVFNSSSVAGATASTINLNTSGVDRIALIFAHVVSQNASARPTIVSVADANGHTWTKYTSLDFDSDNPTDVKQRLEIWWAYCATAQVADTVTVTASANCRGIGLAVGAISGVPATRFTGPFDADPTLPATATNPSATPAAASVTFSTHDAHTVGIIAWAAAITNANVPDTPSGWTNQISLAFNGTGTVNQKLYIYTQVFSAQQVSIAPSLGSKVEWGMMAFGAGGDPIFPHAYANCAGF